MLLGFDRSLIVATIFTFIHGKHSKRHQSSGTSRTDFNHYFINAVKTLYVRGNSCVKLISGTTPKFSIYRGIRQGCPISPFLFLLVTQILHLMVNQNNVFKGIRIHDKEIKISQYADDTTLFLKDQSEVPKTMEIIKDFSQVSGLSLNISKCEILSLKNIDKTAICGIQLKDVINYLGVKISLNSNMVLSELNLTPIKDMVRKKFNSWLARDLSLAGRVLLSKAEGLSRVSYLFSVMDCPKSSCVFLDKLLYNFIWKNKSHKVKKEVLRNKISDGGLEVVDFTLFNHVLKVNWLKRFVRKTDSIWNTFPNFIFKKIGGIEFLLQCPFSLGKLPIKLAKFHQQALLSWLLVYKHNFSPHRCFIWNNQNIVYRNKSLFFERWYLNNIYTVNQLIDDNGQLFSFSEFSRKFDFGASLKEYNTVFNAIPSGIKTLLKGEQSFNPVSIYSPNNSISVEGILIVEDKFNNRFVRNHINRKSIPASSFKWMALYNVNWSAVWSLPHKYLLTNKIKEVTFKILHRCYPCNSVLNKYMQNIEKKKVLSVI
uniref:Reverse transcriptase domain-containing protein n=1 Tax=Cyprinus carpio carpio TaxID=630221 RepID=A0A9J8C6A8_CYPCA